MHSIRRAGASCVAASVAVLAAGEPAGAAPKPITGKLSRPGYTVIALAANGKARSVRPRAGRFRLRPPAGSATLHLRASNGTYAGPIVVGGGGKHVIVGVRAGARLGNVKVRKGYAKLARALPKKLLNTTRWARAKKGVPIGAGVFGRVRSPHTRGGAPGDPDLDGIPDPLDVDDDGDLILDNLDRSTRVRTAQIANDIGLASDLTLDLPETVNANAAALSDDKIDAALSRSGDGHLFIRMLPGVASTELDCGGSLNPSPPPPWVGGLVYCTRGGTGKSPISPAPPGPPFPECCDPDNDGQGTLDLLRLPGQPGPGAVVEIVHGATSAQIKTGDVLIERGNDASGAEIVAFPATLQYVFATVPALVRYSDTAKPTPNSATLSYPAAPGYELPVAGGPDGNLVVTLTFWRPQRRPIPGEPGYGVPGRWTDIGGLNYTATLEGGGGSCPQSAFSEDDPNLTPWSGGKGLTDTRDPPDQPASPANTLTYTLNLTQCLTSNWNPGETRRFHFVTSPPNGGGIAQQIVVFKRQ